MVSSMCHANAMTATDPATATRLIDNYIGGAWTPATAATDELDVTNPATGEALARGPLSGQADLDPPRRRAGPRAAVGPDLSRGGRARRPRGAAPRARRLGDRPRAQAVRAARAP